MKRKLYDNGLTILVYASALLVVGLLVALVLYLLIQGLPHITWEFLSTSPSELRQRIGILPFIINTVYLIVIALAVATPIGVFSAIYLQEYAHKNKILIFINRAIDVLAGIPSVVYGLFGFIFFNQVLGFGYSLYSGAFTLSLIILPTIIKTTMQSMSEVNKSYKEASLGMGATRLYTIKNVILPVCLPGIINGIILSIGRIVSESAALIYTSGLGSNLPDGIISHASESGASLTVQLYLYAVRGERIEISYAIASILIIIVIFINILTKIIGRKVVRRSRGNGKD